MKSVNAASLLICQKFLAWSEENVSVRGNGIASVAAIAKTQHNHSISRKPGGESGVKSGVDCCLLITPDSSDTAS